MIKVGAWTAQAVIEAASEQVGNTDAAALRVGVLEFLRVYADQAAPDESDLPLLTAYRDWLDTAVALYSSGDESKVREYARRGALVSAELELVSARAGQSDGEPSRS